MFVLWEVYYGWHLCDELRLPVPRATRLQPYQPRLRGCANLRQRERLRARSNLLRRRRRALPCLRHERYVCAGLLCCCVQQQREPSLRDRYLLPTGPALQLVFQCLYQQRSVCQQRGLLLSVFCL